MSKMACSRRGRGRGGRGCPNQPSRNNPTISTPAAQRRSRKTMRKTVQEAERAYKEGTDEDIRKLIQELEENIKEEYSETEMEEWGDLIPDPGNTRGRMTLYK